MVVNDMRTYVDGVVGEWGATLIALRGLGRKKAMVQPLSKQFQWFSTACFGGAGYWHTPAPVRYFIRAPNLIGFQATWLQDRPFGDSAWRGERFITKKNDFFEKKTCAHNSARV